MSIGPVVEKIIEEEVIKRIGGTKDELKLVRSELTKSKTEISNLKNNMLKYKEVAENIDSFNFLKQIVNKDNIHTTLSVFGLKEFGIDLSKEDHSNRFPNWMKALIKYYPDKERVISLFKFFEIEAPKWAENFVMPQDLKKEDVIYAIKNISECSYGGNSRYDGNLYGYYETLKDYSGTIRGSRGLNSFNLPLQYFFKNKFLLDDDVFEIIIATIKSGRTSKTEHLFNIHKYQILKSEQIFALMEVLPSGDKWQDSHKRFVADHGPECIKVRPQLARTFKSKMESSQSSSMYYLNFPLNMQIDYIASRNNDSTEQINLIRKMDISKEDKIALFDKLKLL